MKNFVVYTNIRRAERRQARVGYFMEGKKSPGRKLLMKCVFTHIREKRIGQPSWLQSTHDNEVQEQQWQDEFGTMTDDLLRK